MEEEKAEEALDENDITELVNNENISNERSYYEVQRSDKSEHMLPVHFLPEGKKCYDWTTEDLKKNTEKHTCTEVGSSTVSSITYSNCRMISAGESEKEQIVNDLLIAAEHGDLENLKLILNAKPLYINCSDSDGYTALHRACYSGHENIVLYLLDHNGSVHSRTDDNWQPLHCAVRWNQLNICKILLDQNADVNSTTTGKQTPLHFAALTSHSQSILEMLLLHPDINTILQNGAGDTAYDLAFRNGPQYQMFELVADNLRI